MLDPESVFVPPVTARPLGTVVPTGRFMMAHPAHVMALGFGSGLSPKAPGTMGTLWAWALFVLLQDRLTESQWGWLIVVSILAGWWVCAVTARHMRTLDPSSIVWDEIAAFWLVLWLVSPTDFWGQLAAFALFRYFDAVKPGPVAWADQLYHQVDPSTDPGAWRKAGWGIMLDDLVAAFCTLLVIALWRTW
ncbi:phosphatidylglycerophosphatase A [Rhodoferax sp.]|uniref:phosphatidylglycerophosphatase A family protein n=1 Tax=Rhodoferax sp. TaxID=50421 RepID=UPI00351D8D9B